MTDNEIIKALEICNSLHLRCGNGCPYYEVPYKGGKRCSEMMIEDAVDLINRQKAEIERLEDMLDGSVSSERNTVDNIQYEKVEAIKEFAERLKEEINNDRLENFLNGLKGTPQMKVVTYDCLEDYIDNLVKEMTEQ